MTGSDFPFRTQNCVDAGLPNCESTIDISLLVPTRLCNWPFRARKRPRRFHSHHVSPLSTLPRATFLSAFPSNRSPRSASSTTPFKVPCRRSQLVSPHVVFCGRQHSLRGRRDRFSPSSNLHRPASTAITSRSEWTCSPFNGAEETRCEPKARISIRL